MRRLDLSTPSIDPPALSPAPMPIFVPRFGLFLSQLRNSVTLGSRQGSRVRGEAADDAGVGCEQQGRVVSVSQRTVSGCCCTSIIPSN